MGLKNVPALLGPDLLHALCSMGHGDEIVLGDAGFPSSSVARAGGAVEIRLDGHAMPAVLAAVLQVLPLDTYVAEPAAVMALVPDDAARGLSVPLWADFARLLKAAEGKEIAIEKVERFAFYERAKKAYAVVSTGETAKYANIILKKGLVDYGQEM